MQPGFSMPLAAPREWHPPRITAGRYNADSRDLLLAAFLCAAIVTCLAVISERYHHWFILPVILCGAIVGRDAVPWIRNREMLFGPSGVMSVLGFHMFFVSPLLMAGWDYEMLYLSGQPEDWRNWLGIMAWLNAGGLCLYLWARKLVRGRKRRAGSLTYRCLHHREFPTICWILILICTGVQIYLYVTFGGITGFAERYLNDAEVWKNKGWLFAIAESAPILAMIMLAVHLRKSRRKPSWIVLTIVLTGFFAAQLLFGALRGSRMNTLICLFWAVGIVHYWIRPVQRKMLLFGIAFVMLFMYIAAFYKDTGLGASSAFEGSTQREILSARTHRTFRQMVVADLTRTDIQAYTVFRLLQPLSFDYAHGRTYAGALALLVPRTLWNDRPPGKVKWTTELEYGPGSYEAYAIRSSRVYGISGELMLNFGFLAAPLGLPILGCATGRILRFLDSAHPHDCRLLMVPIYICLCLAALLLDSDNLLFFVVKYIAIPGAAIMFTSRNVSVAAARRA